MFYHWVYDLPHYKKCILSKNEENPRMEHMGSIHEFSLVGLQYSGIQDLGMGLVVFTELQGTWWYLNFTFLECACETAVWTWWSRQLGH